MIDISVIMLVYNREKYVARAIESILNQTFKNFEFIIVDNGSSDASGKICAEFTTDNRVKLIHRSRGNIGSGRNTGLDCASGKYILFVDDDDVAEPDLLEFLFDLVTTHDGDIALCGSYRNENDQVSLNCVFDDLKIMDAEEGVIELLNRKNYNAALPTKLIKRELFKPFRFCESGSYDDITFTYKIFASAKRIVGHGKPKYTFYRHTSNNSSFTTNDRLLSPAQLNEYFKAFSERSTYLAKHLPNLEHFGKYSEWSYLISMCNKIVRNKLYSCFEQYQYIYEELSDHYKAFYNSEYTKPFEREWMNLYINERSKAQFQFDCLLSFAHGEPVLAPRKFIMYGTGGYARAAFEMFQKRGLLPIAICDSSEELVGTQFEHYEIMSYKTAMSQHGDADVFIASGKFFEEIKTLLLKDLDPCRLSAFNYFDKLTPNEFLQYLADNECFLKQFIEALEDDTSRGVLVDLFYAKYMNRMHYYEGISSEDQYFNEITNPSSHERLIDGGAFVGDTLKTFTNFVSNQYERIHCFEPSPEPFKLLEAVKNSICEDESVKIYNMGLYSESNYQFFNNHQGEGGDCFSDQESDAIKIKVVTIDDFIDEDVTFIKLDVEGCELDVLKGACETIKKCKPKLAVCVYHKEKDLIEIPKYLMSLEMGYKYYLRHHGSGQNIANETVLYAI